MAAESELQGREDLHTRSTLLVAPKVNARKLKLMIVQVTPELNTLSSSDRCHQFPFKRSQKDTGWKGVWRSLVQAPIPRKSPRSQKRELQKTSRTEESPAPHKRLCSRV